MSALLFADQENVGLRVPPNKDRLRLKSAPELQGGRVFKTPCAPFTPLPRPALGSIRKATHTHTPLSSGTHTPNVRLQRDALLRCREKEPQQHVEDEEPEKMFPYSPDEFEQYDLADVVYLGSLPLAGVPRLPWQPVIPETDEITLEPCEPLAPFYSEDYATELDDFLLTIDELIVDLPPPPEDPLDL
ncbi:securin isoform X1 [Sardina pilchardus]|uniref:securin isoform X1 n=1 Tax=Sardina pilchardus TaxID=27697 RepID=UPI002E14026F